MPYQALDIYKLNPILARLFVDSLYTEHKQLKWIYQTQ